MASSGGSGAGSLWCIGRSLLAGRACGAGELTQALHPLLLTWVVPDVGSVPGRSSGAGGQLSGKVCPQPRPLFDWRPLAFLLQCLIDNQAIVFVGQHCHTAVFARDLVAKLPQEMGGMAN